MHFDVRLHSVLKTLGGIAAHTARSHTDLIDIALRIRLRKRQAVLLAEGLMTVRLMEKWGRPATALCRKMRGRCCHGQDE